MSYRKDYWERIRKYVIPKLGEITQFIEDITGAYYYVKGETHNNQFVGRVPLGEESFEKELSEMGFERNPLASWKRLASTGEQEEGSFRKIGFDKHPDKQLHVVLYDGKKINNAEVDVTYVYAHLEYRWDTDPIKHYRSVEMSGPDGVRMMKKLLDENGIMYEPIRP
jgi:hypothetical protein